MQNYKWIIEYNKDTQYFLLAGYIWVNGRWTRDGAVLSFSHLHDALLRISSSTHETYGVN